MTVKTFGVVVRLKLPPGYVGAWINIYWRDRQPRAGGAYQTRSAADAIAKPYRHDCVFVVVAKQRGRQQ